MEVSTCIGLHKALSRQSAFQAGRITLRCSLYLQGSRTPWGSSGATWTTLQWPPFQAALGCIRFCGSLSSPELPNTGVPTDLVPIARHYLHLIASALSRHFLGPLPTHIPITHWTVSGLLSNLHCAKSLMLIFLLFFKKAHAQIFYHSRNNAKYSVWFCFKHLNKWKITFLQSTCTHHLSC